MKGRLCAAMAIGISAGIGAGVDGWVACGYLLPG